MPETAKPRMSASWYGASSGAYNIGPPQPATALLRRGPYFATLIIAGHGESQPFVYVGLDCNVLVTHVSYRVSQAAIKFSV